MKLFSSILIIFNIFAIVNSLHSFNIKNEIVRNVLNYKNVKFVTFFTCFNRDDSIKLFHSVKDSYLNIITPDFFDKPNGSIDGKTNLGFVLDLSCNNYEKVFDTAERHHLYESRYKWIILDRYNQVLKNNTPVSHNFANIRLRMDSDVTLALFNYENTTVSLFDVYNPGFSTNKEIKITQIGIGTPTNIIYNHKLTKYKQRRDMTGIFVKCGIVKTRTDATTSIDEYYRQVTVNNYDTINKLSYSLFSHILEIHNFIPNITIVDKWFGGALGGVDDGLAKLLYENELDVGISAGLLKPDRIPFIDFAAPAYPFRTCFIFRNPGRSSTIENQFLKPFDASLWFAVLISILLFSVTLKFIAYIARIFTNQDIGETSWAATSLLAWAILCQQGAAYIPKPTSGRCTILSLLLMSLLLYNYYTSSIVSSLLSGLPPPFTTIEELSHSNLKVGIEDVVYTRTLFEVTQDPRIKFLYNHKVLEKKEPAYIKVEDGIANVKKGGFAYHTEPTTGYPIIQSTFEPYEICDLAEINVFSPTVLWTMIQKRSQYKKLFAIGYLKMLESGIISRQQSIWITKKPACLTNTHLVQVGIQPLLPAFFVLLFGACIAISLWILEIITKKFKKSMM